MFGPAAVGVAQGWQADDQSWTLTLPFAFGFYDGDYTSVEVSSNGFLHFDVPGAATGGANSTAQMITNRRIAPLWDDLTTEGLGHDVFVDTTVADQVTIRWAAANKADGSPVNVAATLFADGEVRFDYGSGNTNLTPTVGVSKGESQTFTLSRYDGQTDLADVDSVHFRSPAVSYDTVDLGSSAFAAVGTPQNWRDDDWAWTLNLPFAFPFYDSTYSSVAVSSNGLLHFDPADPDDAIEFDNGTVGLAAYIRIAALWDDLRTDGLGDDIFVDTTVSGQVTIRWDATTFSDSSDVNFSVTLVDDGRIRFHYGPGNTNLTPTVGISAGNDQDYVVVPGYDAQPVLTDANSVEFSLPVLPGPPGLPDYTETSLDTNLFYGSAGIPQNWRSNNSYVDLGLPFVFPFYDGSYDRVWVSTEGFLHFAGDGGIGDGANSTDALRQNRRIAPLWDNLRTDGPANDIFADYSVPSQLTVRWNATNEADSSDVNVAVVLFEDGRIVFDYGPGNTGLSPTVGISAGNGEDYVLLPGYDAQPVLTHANAVEIAEVATTTYQETVLPDNQYYAEVGTAQNWRSNATGYDLTLPFAFPFYDASYSTVRVSTEGFIHFAGGGSIGDGANSTVSLRANRRIAPLWDNLRTNGPGDDIFVDTSTAGQVIVRWNATNESDQSDVHFAAVLFDDGRIRFDYGPGNVNLTPTVGISMGDGFTYRMVAAYDGAESLTNAGSIEFLQASMVISIDDVVVQEGDVGSMDAVFTVSLSAAAESTITVDYVTGAATATEGNDYVPRSGTLTFLPGQTERTIRIPVLGDLQAELDESFHVNLSDAVGAAIADGQGECTILDDDTRIVTVTDVNVAPAPARTVDVIFSGQMTIGPMIADGSIITAVSLIDLAGGPLTLTGDQFTYDGPTRTLDWSTARALPGGTYELRLDGSMFWDLAGNLLSGGFG